MRFLRRTILATSLAIVGLAFPGTTQAAAEPLPEGETEPSTVPEAPFEIPAAEVLGEPSYSEPFPGDPWGGDEGQSEFQETGASRDPFGSEVGSFQVNGYLQSQVGVFFGWEKDRFEEDVKANKVYPTDHGNKLGELSMFRNTLQIEADWQPTRAISLHTILRGVLSSKLPSDRDAQVPDAGYVGQSEKRRQWVLDRYYNELDVRELYLDIEAHPLLNFRVGRQQVSWGETGQYRLLDVINPTDSTWHFGPLESFEDQRIPNWMLKAQLEIPPLRGWLEGVWVPALDRPEDMVTVPLTFVGAWGLPPPPKQGDASLHPNAIHSKIFLWPQRDVRNSRAGARWRGEAGPVTYTLAYFWTHVQSPPIPLYFVTPYSSGASGYDVYLGFPRQHVVGASMEVAVPHPVTLNIKLEAAFEPDRTYPVHSLKKRIRMDPAVAAEIGGDRAVGYYFDNPKKKVFSWALTLQRPSTLRWLNPEMSTMFVLQFMHTWITDFKPLKRDADGLVVDQGDYILEIPGYDSTLAEEHTFRLVGAIFTTYLKGMLTPRIIGAWLPKNGGFLSLQLDVALGNHWRILAAVNQFFGSDPYKGIGLFRDRDEVNVRVRYQF